MPQALALAAAFIASNAAAAVGASVAAQATIAALAAAAGSALFTIGVTTALSYAASAFLRPPSPSPSNQQLELKQATPTRRIHYGRVRVAGPLAFWAARNDGVKNGLFKLVMLSAREIDAVEAHYLDGKEVTIGTYEADFVDQDQYWLEHIPRARIITHLGTEDQLADDLMLTVWTPEWTADHRLQGIAYTIAEFRAVGGEKFTSTFPNGEPDYAALIRGNKLYDPRLDSTVEGGSGSHRLDDASTWAWSDNAVLATLDWLTWPVNRGGFGFLSADFYWPDWIAKADLADEEVPLKAGGTEKRYRVATTVDLFTEQRTAVLKRLLDAWDGRLIRRSDGLIGLKGGEWEEPDVTLGPAHIIEAEHANGISAPDIYNELSFRYLSGPHGYIEVEGDPWLDAEIKLPGGGVRTQAIDLMQVPSHAQARRLAKIITARDNPPFIGEIRRTNMKGIDVLGSECVTLDLPELDAAGDTASGPYWIDGGVTVAGDVSGVSFKCRRARPDIYDWDAATEEGTEPPVPTEIIEDTEDQFIVVGAGGGDALGAGGGDVLGAFVT